MMVSVRVNNYTASRGIATRYFGHLQLGADGAVHLGLVENEFHGLSSKRIVDGNNGHLVGDAGKLTEDPGDAVLRVDAEALVAAVVGD